MDYVVHGGHKESDIIEQRSFVSLPLVPSPSIQFHHSAQILSVSNCFLLKTNSFIISSASALPNFILCDPVSPISILLLNLLKMFSS